MKLLKVLLLAAVLTASRGVTPAMADEGPGTFTLEDAEEVSASEVRYVVRLTFTGDGHPARDATVTATAIDPDGAPQTPVSMSVVDQDGRYEGTLTFPTPGAWTVRFTAVLPPATLDQPQTIEATTTTEGTTTTTTAPPSTDEADDEAASEDSDSSGVPWIVPVLGVAAVIAAGAWFGVRRRRS